MTDRAPQTPDPDDWWETPVTQVEIFRREPDEDWLAAPENEPPPRTRLPTSATTPRIRLLIAGASGVLVLLVLGLVAAGVFSGGTPKPATPTTAPLTTAAHTTTTAKTPTTPKTAQVVGPSVTLNPGAAGPQTKRLQRALTSLGDDPGPVDGSYGPLTAKGIEKFQRSAGLVPDGIFGPKTRAALQRVLTRS